MKQLIPDTPDMKRHGWFFPMGTACNLFDSSGRTRADWL
jgi:hypothetical protein